MAKVWQYYFSFGDVPTFVDHELGNYFHNPLMLSIFFMVDLPLWAKAGGTDIPLGF